MSCNHAWRQAEAAEETRDVLTSCHLSKYANRFESEGYDIVQFLLDATESELADVCAPMKVFERRRLLQVIGIPFNGLADSLEENEMVETAAPVTPAAQVAPATQDTPKQVKPPRHRMCHHVPQPSGPSFGRHSRQHVRCALVWNCGQTGACEASG
jgi:hypothetical protein